MSILDFVPAGYILRPNQETALLRVEAAWANTEIIALKEDVGAGKSLVLRTIAAWQADAGNKSAILTPQVDLQEQYKQSFPGLPLVKGAHRHKCTGSDAGYSCGKIKEAVQEYCEGCPYIAARTKAIAADTAIFNLHSYMTHKGGKSAPVILIDEAHKLFGLLSESYVIKLWCHKYGRPNNHEIFEDLIIWLEGVLEKMREEEETLRDLIGKHHARGSKIEEYEDQATELTNIAGQIAKLSRILKEIKRKNGAFFTEISQEMHYGKKRSCVKLTPKSLEGLTPRLWGQHTKKIVMATATIHEMDLKRLGLSHRKTKVIEGDPTFLKEDRPIIVKPVGNMTWKFKKQGLPKVARYILELQERHKDTKGLVHATYDTAAEIRRYLAEHPNILYHTRDPKDKAAKLQLFKESSPGTVLVGSGMTMGIDLSGPEFGWQALAKVPWPRKTAYSEAVYAQEPLLQLWLTVQEIEQAMGRINRYLGDKGVSYILDTSFGNQYSHSLGLYRKANTHRLWSKQFKERLIWER